MAKECEMILVLGVLRSQELLCLVGSKPVVFPKNRQML